MIEHNEKRPHDALGDLTPVEVRLQSAGNSTYELSPWRGSLRERLVGRCPGHQ